MTILVGDVFEPPGAVETLRAFSLPSSHTTLYLSWPESHNTGPDSQTTSLKCYPS